MVKKILSIVLLVLSLVFMLASCEHTHEWSEWQITKEATCKEEGTKERYCLECDEKNVETIPINEKIHKDLADRMTSANQESSYKELYTLYQEVLNHQKENSCDIKNVYFESTIPYWEKYNLMSAMLYGEWKNANGDYITYTYVYTDYDNTTGSAWYGTNLPTSKIDGNTYYYYKEVKDNKLVIGYQDKITEDKTDNFVITFNTNSITVESKIENKTYTLELNENYDKTQKGNAKTAYVYIAKHIFDYKVPSSVKVTQCYVDYDERIVYATIQASNSFGGTNTDEYKLYMIGNSYYMDEYSHNYSTNIDLTELNQKLQSYVSTGG